MADRGPRAGAAVQLRDMIRAEIRKQARHYDQVDFGTVALVDGDTVEVLLDSVSIPIPVTWATGTPIVGDRVVCVALAGGQQWIAVASLSGLVGALLADGSVPALLLDFQDVATLFAGGSIFPYPSRPYLFMTGGPSSGVPGPFNSYIHLVGGATSWGGYVPGVTIAAGARQSDNVPGSILLKTDDLRLDKQDGSATLMEISAAAGFRLGGSAAYVFGGVPVIFTSSGTFTKASYSGLRAVRIRQAGAGGGSGGCAATAASQGAAGAGGGGGGYAEKFILASALAASETVTVGTGGSAGAAGANNGGSGSNTSFGSHVTSNGGGGGAGSGAQTVPSYANATAGAGGGNSGGDLGIPGGDGAVGICFALRGARAMGGASVLGMPQGNGQNATGANGLAGNLYGGGASGSFNTQSQGTRAGAVGGNGICIVELYF